MFEPGEFPGSRVSEYAYLYEPIQAFEAGEGPLYKWYISFIPHALRDFSRMQKDSACLWLGSFSNWFHIRSWEDEHVAF